MLHLIDELLIPGLVDPPPELENESCAREEQEIAEREQEHVQQQEHVAAPSPHPHPPGLINEAEATPTERAEGCTFKWELWPTSQIFLYIFLLFKIYFV